MNDPTPKPIPWYRRVPEETPYNVWVAWMGATAGGVFAGMVGVVLLIIFVSGEFARNLELMLLASGVLCGLIVGGLQGLVLSRALARGIWRYWIVISVVGITAGLFATRLSWFILDSAYHSLFGVDPYRSSLGLEGLATATLGSAICAALGGLVLGCAQWLVLRRYVERAGQWITGSTAAAAAAAMGVILILWVVLIFGFIQGWGFIYLYLFGIGCMPWPIMAGITGWVLLKLLKEPERPDTTIWTQSTETK